MFRVCDAFIEKFETESIGICQAVSYRYGEIAESDAISKNYREQKFSIVNNEINGNKYEYLFLNLVIHSSACSNLGLFGFAILRMFILRSPLITVIHRS